MTAATPAIERELWTQCRRCGGLMVPDPIHESVVDGGLPAPTEWRCVICGEHVEEIVMEQQRTAEGR